eukprot:9414256-Pyramimonas_sp.AAC.2
MHRYLLAASPRPVRVAAWVGDCTPIVGEALCDYEARAMGHVGANPRPCEQLPCVFEISGNHCLTSLGFSWDICPEGGIVTITTISTTTTARTTRITLATATTTTTTPTSTTTTTTTISTTTTTTTIRIHASATATAAKAITAAPFCLYYYYNYCRTSKTYYFY